jgi:hypothetical protein
MLEDLKEILKDDSLHIFLGQIKRLHLADDRSYLKVEVSVWPEERSIIARMTWDSVGPESGFYAFPAVGDAVLCASAEGDVQQSFVIKRLSSKDDKIPNTATGGDTVLRALSGKKLWNTSDTRINLSKGDSEPTENLVLGQRMKATYSDHLSKLITYLEKVIDYMDKFEKHKHIGNAGFYTLVPDNAGDVATLRSDLETLKTETNSLKSDKVDNEFILSDLSYTEKGN